MPQNRELQKFRESSEAKEVANLLEQAGVNFTVSNTSRAFDVSQIGGLGGDSSDEGILIAVRESDFESARSILEASYLSTPIPDDHYLITASNEDLAEILATPDEWSPFDVVHARSMMSKRGIDLELIEEKKQKRIEALKSGKPASNWLIWGGWAGALTGGLIGVGIAWSLTSMKEKTPEGEFYTYDDRSREIGKKMMSVSIVVLLLLVFLRGSSGQ